MIRGKGVVLVIVKCIKDRVDVFRNVGLWDVCFYVNYIIKSFFF